MSKMLNEVIGSVGFDGLIVANVPAADVVHVTLASGNGTVKRGTVVTGDPGGELAPVSAALASCKAVYILADDAETADAAAVAAAYRCGHFARNKLVTAGDYALTAADEELMRIAGILLADAIEI